MDRATPPPPNEGTPKDATTDASKDKGKRADEKSPAQDERGNPPHTTTGKMTSPKFGSAGSGGAEYEGNLPKD